MNKQDVLSKRILYQSDFILSLLSVFELSLIVIEFGYQRKVPFSSLMTIPEIFLLIAYITNVVLVYISDPVAPRITKLRTLDAIIIFSILFFSISLKTAASLVVGRQFIIWIQKFLRISWIKRLNNILLAKPASLTMFSFMAIILFGTFLLTFPAATVDGKGTPLLTGLFTATSAMCVTGLIVVDTGSYFSSFGQTIILILIQIGGVGIMTLSTSLALVFGHRLGLREQATLQDILDVPDSTTPGRIILYILKLTLFVELVGAVLLFFQFFSHSANFYQSLYSAIFHSISAYCNAGFSLYTDSLIPYQQNWIVNLTICGLIIFGGIGFAVVANVFDRKHLHYGIKHFFLSMTIHTKIVLFSTFLLIVGGTLIIFFFEFDTTLLDLPIRYKLLAAFFQSVTLRTAGFNTIAFTNLKHITVFMMLIWMFIGAAPGSTAGGIKVSTMGVLFLTIRTILTGRRDVEVLKRKIPQSIVYKSIAITLITISMLIVLFGILLITESADFMTLLFESISALATVGLSLGITPDLSGAGQILIIILMYLGRIGPLTLAYAIGENPQTASVSFPDGRIMVG